MLFLLHLINITIFQKTNIIKHNRIYSLKTGNREDLNEIENKLLGKNNTNYGKKDELATNGKKVYMYDKNYNLEKVFNTITLALKYLNLKGHKQLYHAIMNETWYKGHYWRKEFNKI